MASGYTVQLAGETVRAGAATFLAPILVAVF